MKEQALVMLFLKSYHKNVRLVTLEFEDFCKQGTEKQFDENKHLNEQTRSNVVGIYNFFSNIRIDT